MISECTTSAPSPEQGSRITICVAQCCRRINENAEDHRTVIVGQFDKPRLGDEAAKLDQLSGAFAALHLPVARVTKGAC